MSDMIYIIINIKYEEYVEYSPLQEASTSKLRNEEKEALNVKVSHDVLIVLKSYIL